MQDTSGRVADEIGLEGKGGYGFACVVIKMVNTDAKHLVKRQPFQIIVFEGLKHLGRINFFSHTASLKKFWTMPQGLTRNAPRVPVISRISYRPVAMASSYTCRGAWPPSSGLKKIS